MFLHLRMVVVWHERPPVIGIMPLRWSPGKRNQRKLEMQMKSAASILGTPLWSRVITGAFEAIHVVWLKVSTTSGKSGRPLPLVRENVRRNTRPVNHASDLVRHRPRGESMEEPNPDRHGRAQSSPDRHPPWATLSEMVIATVECCPPRSRQLDRWGRAHPQPN